MPIQKNTLNPEDAYDAEQFQWLIQWNNHFYLETDKDVMVLRVQKLELKLLQTKDHLISALEAYQELRAHSERLAFDFYTQKFKLEETENKISVLVNRDQEHRKIIEEMTIESDGLNLQLEEQKASHKEIVANLEQQVRSMQVIISESEQEICQKEAMRRQLLVNLEGQAEEHLQQMAQNQSQEENNVDTITCSICWETWDEEGSHRVVSLACGHLFGDSCIRSYLEQRPNCPICRQEANIQGIRRIFGRHVMPNPTN